MFVLLRLPEHPRLHEVWRKVPSVGGIPLARLMERACVI